MPRHFLDKIRESFPVLEPGPTLLAVSGGLDSMVMAHLFAAGGWPFGIAHVNFKLRGSESDGDEIFVRSLAERFGVPFFCTSFDTGKEAEEKTISVQMAARKFRYDWLEQIRKEHHFRSIATAHHLNDSIETTFINQSRGTGIRGLTGIPARQGNILRPLHSFSRAELENYATENGISYREDRSNMEDDYHRNRIRHHIIPVLRSINSTLENTYLKNFKIWSEAVYLMEWACQELRQNYLKELPGRICIDYGFLTEHPQAALSLLYEWTKDLGFHIDQLQQAVAAAQTGPGAVWYSASHRLLADRQSFIIESLRKEEPAREYSWENFEQPLMLSNGVLKADLSEAIPDFQATQSEWTAVLDADQVNFPARLRHWRPGDVFCPLGMGGQHKKVQDFFSDSKIDRFDKDRAWLLVSATGEIVWIIGYRIDERFKVRTQTQRALTLKFERS